MPRWRLLDTDGTFRYNSVSGLQTFPPLTTHLRGIRQIASQPKSKNNNKLNCKFEYRLDCKQRLMFPQCTIYDNTFMFVDASQFCLCRNPTNCLFSMNKSAHRGKFCNESVKLAWQISWTHPLSCENGHRTHNIPGFLCLRTYQKRSWKYVNMTEKIGKLRRRVL